MKNKAAFLDRDGTIVKDQIYKNDFNNIKFLKNVKKGLSKLIKLNFILIIVTNQSGIARKIVSKNKVNIFNQRLVEKLKEDNITISKVYTCPQSVKDKCLCRKPRDKFALMAKKKFNLNLKESIVIGDKISDKLFGKKYKIKGFLVNKKQDIYEIAKKITKKS